MIYPKPDPNEDRFIYDNGFIVELTDEGERDLVADFHGGAIKLPDFETCCPEKRKQEIYRIIYYLNLAYRTLSVTGKIGGTRW